nr:hypothetical protein [Tanacetum cinerariifolium]
MMKGSAAKSKFTTVGDVKGMDRHNVIFVISSYIKKVFANMKRERKDFSGKVTPLFQSMMVQAPEDMGEGLEIPTDTHHTPIVTQPSSFPPQKNQKSRRKQWKEIEVTSTSCEIPNEESILTPSNDPLPSEVKTAPEKEIASLKKRVKKLEQKRKSVTSGLKRLRKVGTASRVESSTEASLGDQEDASKQGRMIDNINQDLEITLVNDTQGRMNEEDMFGVNDVDGDDMVADVSASEKVEQSVKVVEKEVGTADPVTTVGKVVTTAATIVTATGTRPKGKGIVMQEPFETPSPKPIDSSQKPSQAKHKGKGKMVEPERPLKRKD